MLVLSGQAAFRNTWELLRSFGQLTIESVEDEIRAHVKPAEEIAKYMTKQVADGEIDPANSEEMLGALKGVLAAAPQIAGIVLWDKDFQETQITRSPDGGLSTVKKDQPENPGFARFINATRQIGKTRWAPPGADDDGQTYVYVVSPLNHQGTYWGVIATGVTLSELSKSVEEVGKEVGMTAFILYGDQFVLAHPDLEVPTASTVGGDQTQMTPPNKIKDGVVRKFFEVEPEETPKEVGFEVREIEDNDQHYLVLSRTNTEFGDVPWHIGIYAPVEDIYTQVIRLIISIAAGILVLVVAVIGAILLARRIANPIRTLATAAEQIGRFDIANIKPLPASRIRELNDQANAFNTMLDGLKWFETYVPKTLVTRLISGHHAESVQSQELDLTVMFTDIIGFTAMSESMAPAAVAEMLNDHFEVLAQAIEKENGTLDKYIGDAVMAFWGAPDNQDDHAVRACRAALAIADALEAANRNTSPDHPSIRIKLALHSGPLLVGNIGATSRMNYTVIGDTVNTCSRIESLCREFDDGTSAAIILVSEDTAALARSHAGFRFTQVGEFEVKGRNEQVRVCRLERS